MLAEILISDSRDKLTPATVSFKGNKCLHLSFACIVATKRDFKHALKFSLELKAYSCSREQKMGFMGFETGTAIGKGFTAENNSNKLGRSKLDATFSTDCTSSNVCPAVAADTEMDTTVCPSLDQKIFIFTLSFYWSKGQITASSQALHCWRHEGRWKQPSSGTCGRRQSFYTDR